VRTEETGSFTSALIIQEKRVFGIDSYPRDGIYHMHPVENAENHLAIKAMQIEEILAAYARVLQH
jgi:hypothetical protein